MWEIISNNGRIFTVGQRPVEGKCAICKHGFLEGERYCMVVPPFSAKLPNFKVHFEEWDFVCNIPDENDAIEYLRKYLKKR